MKESLFRIEFRQRLENASNCPRICIAKIRREFLLIAHNPNCVAIAADFAPRGVKFFGVYATETAQEITTHRKEYKLPFPGLLDPKCQLARHAGATRVPEVAVFSPGGELIYRGRIDDRATQPGSMKPTASRHDLRAALDASLAGKKPEPRFTKAIGCYLPL